ncbi:MAG: uroporphyrinogen-III synthase [Coxiellaceae bacterium]|nr:uroporphyrinogen-III synthase [Coxiellaceae bacterium]
MKVPFIILNTRPKNQSHALTLQLQSMGAQIVELPLIEIEPVFFSEIVYKTDIALFLSANAVNYFCHKATVECACIIAIGPATAQALSNHGYENTMSPLHFSSEGLLEMPALQEPQHKKIMIISGEDSKALLPDTLKSRGACIQKISCYRRKRVSYKASTLISALQCGYIIVTSSEIFQALLNLFEAHAAWLKERTLCVISDEMKRQVKSLGFRSVIQAKNATTEAIIEALVDDNRNKQV